MSHRIAVIGAGWMGEPLCRLLMADGHEVTATGSTPGRAAELQAAGIRAVPYRLGEAPPAALRPADIVVLTIPPRIGGADVDADYPRRMAALVESLDAGRNLRFVYTSSTGVYTDAPGLHDESAPIAPGRPSAAAVAAAEELLRGLLGARLAILRFAGLVGGGRHPTRRLAGRRGVPRGDAPVNMLSQADAAGIVAHTIAVGAWGGLYNACCREHPTRARFHAHEAAKLGIDAPTFLPGGWPGRVIDSMASRRDLGYVYTYEDPLDIPV
jgi:nucleoside-diphosphate-sugar epimerase